MNSYSTTFLLLTGTEIPIEVDIKASNIEEVMGYWNRIIFGGSDTVCCIQTGEGAVRMIPKDKIVSISIRENKKSEAVNWTASPEDIPGVAIVKRDGRTGHADIQNL